MQEDNRRAFTRIEIGLPVDLQMEGGRVLHCLTRDLSYRGVFLITNESFAPGTPADLTVWLGRRGSGLGLRIFGTVTRQTPSGVGVQIEEIAYEAFEHLRQLVAYNAPDPSVVDQEINRDLGLSG